MFKKQRINSWFGTMTLCLLSGAALPADEICMVPAEFSSSCAAELVSAEGYEPGGNDMRSYEIRGSCQIKFREDCQARDGDYAYTIWPQVGFIFGNSRAYFDPATSVARFQGYLISESAKDYDDTFLRGSKDNYFIEFEYVCTADPWITPDTACVPPQYAGYWVDGKGPNAQCRTGSEAICPFFGGSLSKQEVLAFSKKAKAEKLAAAEDAIEKENARRAEMIARLPRADQRADAGTLITLAPAPKILSPQAGKNVSAPSAIKAAVSAGKPELIEFEIEANRDGHWSPVVIRSVPVYNDAGQFVLTEAAFGNVGSQPVEHRVRVRAVNPGSHTSTWQTFFISPVVRQLADGPPPQVGTGVSAGTPVARRIESVLAPQNSCRAQVTYYVPDAPVISANAGTLQADDQHEILCVFRRVTREVEWPQCGAAARSAIQVLKMGQDSGSRYSGMVSIDDGTAGVSSSPLDGGDFESTQLWSFDTAGTHEVSCQIDNPFRFVAEGEPTYLKAAVTLGVDVRTDARTYRGFERGVASPIRTKPVSAESSPLGLEYKLRIVESASVSEASTRRPPPAQDGRQ